MPALGPLELLIIVVFLGVIAAVLGAVVLAAVRGTRTGARGVEERLRELDDLRARGVITHEEHAAARARALGG